MTTTMKFSIKSFRWQTGLTAAVLLSGPFVFHGFRPPVPPASALPGSLTRFVDVADKAGLRYEFKKPKRPLTLLTTFGDGCAFLDYNGDGNLDILLVSRDLALFKGDGKGRFSDVTKETGLSDLSGHFLGCGVGDYDNDGWGDLYISGWRTGLLLKNEQGKRFRDVTKAMGLGPQPWGSSCGFADLDNDGYLDLYVANYVQFGPESKPQHCESQGKDRILLSSCGPGAYPPVKGVLYHNQAGRSFRDVTRAWGADTHHGNGLAVAFADFDDSGNVSFAVSNDNIYGDLFHNRGRGRLKNIGKESGTSGEPNGDVHAGMGADWGDYDNDGDLDLYVATFQEEVKSLYRNDGGGAFTDVGEFCGILEPAWPYVTFGSKFFDADNDGWLDLMTTNGHIKDYVDLFGPFTFRQPSQFFHNKGGKRASFEEISAKVSKDLTRPLVGRGLAVGDYDNDGRVDALIVDSEGKPLLLHNESVVPKKGWIGFRLVGGERMNRDAYGAVLTVTSDDGTRWVRQCQPSGSYLSSSDARVHFGLGAYVPQSVAVRWPDGTTETWKNLPTGRYLTLSKGKRPQ